MNFKFSAGGYDWGRASRYSPNFALLMANHPAIKLTFSPGPNQSQLASNYSYRLTNYLYIPKNNHNHSISLDWRYCRHLILITSAWNQQHYFPQVFYYLFFSCGWTTKMSIRRGLYTWEGLGRGWWHTHLRVSPCETHLQGTQSRNIIWIKVSGPIMNVPFPFYLLDHPQELHCPFLRPQPNYYE